MVCKHPKTSSLHNQVQVYSPLLNKVDYFKHQRNLKEVYWEVLLPILFNHPCSLLEEHKVNTLIYSRYITRNGLATYRNVWKFRSTTLNRRTIKWRLANYRFIRGTLTIIIRGIIRLNWVTIVANDSYL